LDVMRWGLIPYWAKDIKIGYSTINARAEEVEGKPAFREAFRHRRCLVPLDSFYEWKKTETGKQPYAIGFAGGRIMAMAGLWDTWRSLAGERVHSFTIVTTTPNELCAALHNRMPVVLKPTDWPAWLGEEPADLPHLKSLLAPYAGDDMIRWPVSSRVGDVKNNDPSLIESVTRE
jgi:putative SOS response-associated peptidase YedK